MVLEIDAGATPLTRLHTPCVAAEGFGFVLARRGLFSHLGALLPGRAPKIDDPELHAYVTHADGGRVSLIDTHRRVVVRLLAVGLSPYGIAIAPDGGCAYVANSGSDTVSVLDASVAGRRGAPTPPPLGPAGPLPLPSPAQPQAVLGMEGGTGAGIAAERHRFVPPNPGF